MTENETRGLLLEGAEHASDVQTRELAKDVLRLTKLDTKRDLAGLIEEAEAREKQLRDALEGVAKTWLKAVHPAVVAALKDSAAYKAMRVLVPGRGLSLFGDDLYLGPSLRRTVRLVFEPTGFQTCYSSDWDALCLIKRSAVITIKTRFSCEDSAGHDHNDVFVTVRFQMPDLRKETAALRAAVAAYDAAFEARRALQEKLDALPGLLKDVERGMLAASIKARPGGVKLLNAVQGAVAAHISGEPVLRLAIK